MNLFEGNNFFGIWGDDAWGSSGQDTYFRNLLQAWQNGKTASTFPILLRAYIRNLNIVGNVMGQAGYHSQYQANATSTSGGNGGGAEDKSIYSIGWAGTGAACSSGSVTHCDPLSFSTLMRWGNYDTVTGGVKWDTTEASPCCGALRERKSSLLVTSLLWRIPCPHRFITTPNPRGGPQGRRGLRSDRMYRAAISEPAAAEHYAGNQATSSGQCTGGSLSSAWAAHATSIPAQDCYLNVMHGPPDGTGSLLNFDASQCYTSSGTAPGNPTPPPPPTALSGTVI